MDVRDNSRKAFSHFSFKKLHNLSRNHSSYKPNNNKGCSNNYLGMSRQSFHAFNRGYPNYCDYNHKSNKDQKNVKTNNTNDIQPWSEEAKEKERKQQLSDAANKLMNKLKMWNAKKNEEECQTNDPESSLKHHNPLVIANEEDKSVDSKPVCVNSGGVEEKKWRKKHLSKQKLKTYSENSKTNSESKHIPSKLQLNQNKQKKIQQNLIGELMTMPKANLQKVLVDPKMDPRIEKGMAQIVKENRMILAQKFRALAESKINNKGQFLCSTFVDDVGSFIDPDLAIDLCQLPPEVIKQLGEMFQLDFSPGSRTNNNVELDINCSRDSYSEVEMDCSDASTCNDSVSELATASSVKIKTEPKDDEEIGASEILEDNEFVENYIKIEPHISEYSNENSVVSYKDHVEDISKNEINGESSDYSNIGATIISRIKNEVEPNNSVEVKPLQVKKEFSVNFHDTSFEFKESTVVPCLKKEIFEIIKPSNDHLLADSIEGAKPCKTNIQESEKCLTTNETDLVLSRNSQCNAEVQTEINLIDLNFDTHLDDIEDNLIREVKAIDNLVHKLNQRRFSLFLKLMSLKSCTSKQNALKWSLIQTISNGDRRIINILDNKKRKKRCNRKSGAKRPHQEQMTDLDTNKGDHFSK
ncbi:UNVERIFIED_CONTAM: hypothetical protein PYX00_007308 [Menopon gallinae]|uniref:Uncharacterized protein n=1 Tax=Menopon gallinae TaxID=328185 RepID=A0AAW2HIW7_9NEOP